MGEGGGFGVAGFGAAGFGVAGFGVSDFCVADSCVAGFCVGMLTRSRDLAASAKDTFSETSSAPFARIKRFFLEHRVCLL